MATIDLTGRVALVTGSTQGLGQRVACDLARSGATVCVHGAVERAAGHVTVQAIEKAGGRASYLPFDVRDAQAVADGVRVIEQQLGPIDIAINCVSRFEHGPLDQLTPEAWSEVVDSTLTGTYHICHAVLPGMRQRGWGRVVTFGCVGCDHVPHTTRMVPYVIAASGNLALTRAYAQLAFADGVTVNLIAPGHMENTVAPCDASKLPAGRLTALEEILPSIRYLLSDDAAHVSGTCLNVSGGYAA